MILIRSNSRMRIVIVPGWFMAASLGTRPWRYRPQKRTFLIGPKRTLLFGAYNRISHNKFYVKWWTKSGIILAGPACWSRVRFPPPPRKSDLENGLYFPLITSAYAASAPKFNNCAYPFLEQKGITYYNWAVFMDEPSNLLGQVRSVEYLLHPSFPIPEAILYEDRAMDGFKLNGSGWGSFGIQIAVTFKDNKKTNLVHRLDLTKRCADAAKLNGLKVLWVDDYENNNLPELILQK